MHTLPTPRVLFALKRRELKIACETPYSYSQTFSSGLYNSVRFVSHMLCRAMIENKIVECRDNDDIDPAVREFNPTHVIVEALWVVPEKIKRLQELHPDVKWVIRLHSDIPFLSNEGIAMDWIIRCIQFQNVSIAPNSVFALRDLKKIIRNTTSWSEEQIDAKLVLLPNYYPLHGAGNEIRSHHYKGEDLDVGCFGAVRPLKNNLIQAVAAIHYADREGYRLRFHINGGRSEQGGEQNLKNLRALFNSSNHTLIEHPWMAHDEFLGLLRTMDLSMCVSFTETFCIVAADSIACGVPTVVSNEIRWGSPLATARATDSDSITRAIERALHPIWGRLAAFHTKRLLGMHCDSTWDYWLDWLGV